jgi:hypothetical protein
MPALNKQGGLPYFLAVFTAAPYLLWIYGLFESSELIGEIIQY